MNLSNSKPGKQLQRAARKGNVAQALAVIDKVPVVRIEGACVLAVQYGHADFLSQLMEHGHWQSKESCAHLWREAVTAADTQYFDVVMAYTAKHPGRSFFDQLNIYKALNAASQVHAYGDDPAPHTLKMISSLSSFITDNDTLCNALRQASAHRIPQIIPILLQSPAGHNLGVSKSVFGSLLAAMNDNLELVDLLMQACVPHDLLELENEFKIYRDSEEGTKGRFGLRAAHHHFLMLMEMRHTKEQLQQAVNETSGTQVVRPKAKM